jgi:hypothetical protein
MRPPRLRAGFNQGSFLKQGEDAQALRMPGWLPGQMKMALSAARMIGEDTS